MIRPLAAADIADAALLFEMQLAEHEVQRSRTEIAASLATLLSAPEQGVVFVAFSNAKALGVAFGTRILSLEHGGWSGWLDELYVLPDWRGQKIGSALLDAVVKEAQARGWKSLDLEVDAAHHRVISLYDRNCFQPVSRRRFVRRIAEE
ncbi:MAG: GNAT family N-acetyltransferase [Chthoniobacterales bacterium]